MLDASKAFDGVIYEKLFELLINRGLPMPMLRLLLYQYTHQLVRTTWQGESSDIFSTVNGVRQGGVLSPVLFTVYIDVLLQRLKDKGLGCMVGQTYFGVLCYADDVTLLSPTRNGLQQMLEVCEKFGEQHNIKYNPKKTVCMCFGPNSNAVTNVTLYGKPLSWSTHSKHLGNIIRADLSEHDDVQRKKFDFIGRTNSLVANFKSVPKTVCSTVFTSQCCHFYGMETWNLSDRYIGTFYVTWRKAVRKIWNLPNTARSAMLPFLVQGEPVHITLNKRVQGLYRAIKNSENAPLQYLLQTSIDSLPSGIAGSNNTYSSSVSDFHAADPSMQDRAAMVKEITRSLENELYIDNFSKDELLQLKDFIATF